MRYADSAERRTFGKVECVKSVFAFLFNYLILLLLVALFIWMNTLAIEGESFTNYVKEHYNVVIYLLASIFILCLTIYFYYILRTRVCSPPRATSG